MDALRSRLAGVALEDDRSIALAKVPGGAIAYVRDLDGSASARALAKLSNYAVTEAMFKKYNGAIKEVRASGASDRARAREDEARAGRRKRGSGGDRRRLTASVVALDRHR